MSEAIMTEIQIEGDVDLEGKLPDIIKKLQDIQEKIPEEFRPNAELEVNAEEYYYNARIIYRRMETENETAKREACALQAKRDQIARLADQLARLQAA